MKCEYCGAKIDGQKFCPECGMKVEIKSSDEIPGPDAIVKHIAMIGTGLGLGCGLITLVGWFSPWTGLNIGNGPQIVALPFAILMGKSILQDTPLLGSVVGSVDQITGWVLLFSIVFSLVAIVLGALSLLSLWIGVKCLENRADPKMVSFIKAQMAKLRNYGITGIVFIIAIMVVASFFQFGQEVNVIGGGVFTMGFGFIVAFLAVIYLKPHLR